MPTFIYSAYGARGEFAEGRVDAASPEAAADLLSLRGLTPFQMTAAQTSEAPWWQRELPLGPRRTARHLASFTRELSTLAAAGIPLDDALRIICDQSNGAATAGIAKELRHHVLNGVALSEAMEKKGGLFSADYLSMVRAGEVSGSIAPVLNELADLLERRQEVKSRIRSALVYPVLLLGLATLSLGIIVWVLVPSIVGIFEGSGRPMPAALALATELHTHWLQLALGLAGFCSLLALGVWYGLSNPIIRRAADHRLLKMPVVGPFLLDQETSRFCRILGTLLKAGVPVLPSSISANGVARNSQFADGITRAIESIREGAALHHALQTQATLSPLALRMIRVGEEAGKLDTMLTSVASMLEQKSQRTAERLMTILTPMLTIVMACIVGGLVMAVIDAVMSVNELAIQ